MDIEKLNLKSKEYIKKINEIKEEIKKEIVGQDDIVLKLIIALLSDGHILLEGVPGLAKTKMIKTVSNVIESSFNRIQFTPDLLPADIVGTKIYDQKKGEFYTEKGPIFNNLILADEINRAPPKVQSALLEAMQERQVSIHGETFKLDKPFLVLATQNPIETEGTYKLPEAQVDRFMFKLVINYPKKEEEKYIIRKNTRNEKVKVREILKKKEIIEIQKFLRDIYADEKIEDYVSSIVDATRSPEEYDLDIKGFLEYGASPRASIWLIIASKAVALMNGRGYVIPEDIRFIAKEVLRHRIILTYEAEAEEITTDNIIDMILDKVESP